MSTDLELGLIQTCRKAEEILEQYNAYAMDPTNDEKDIDVLTHVISRYVEMDIEMRQVPWRSTQIKGRLLRYQDRAIIDLPEHMPRNDNPYSNQEPENGTLSYCQKRLVAVKEMGHLVIDTQDAFAEYAAELVSSAVNSFLRGDQNICRSENLALIFAVEVLFPFQRRCELMEKYQSGEISALDIAMQFRVPVRHVETMMTQEVHNIFVMIYG